MSCAGTIIVDLDDTLLPDAEASRAAILHTLSEVSAGNVDVDQVLVAARTRWRTGPWHSYFLATGMSSWEGLWIDWLAGERPKGLTSWGQAYRVGVWADVLGAERTSPIVDTAADRFRAHRQTLVRPYPGVLHRLSVLAETHLLVLATNGDSLLQRQKLQLAGIERYFSDIVISSDVGAVKSTSTFWERLLLRLRAGVTVCTVVGDSVSNDLQPAVDRHWAAAHVCGRPPQSCTARLVQVKHHESFADFVPSCAAPEMRHGHAKQPHR
jgi:FMN phosphatase YigB (HAD superfamily)